MIANDIKNWLISAQLEKVSADFIFAGKVDDAYSADDLKDVNFIIISSISDMPWRTASNIPIIRKKEVQIYIVYRQNIDVEPEALEDEIRNVMLEHNYFQFDSDGPSLNVDGDRYYSTLKFQSNADKY